MGKRQRAARKLWYAAFFLAASSLVAAQVVEQPQDQQQQPPAGAAPESNGPSEPPEVAEADVAYAQALQTIRLLKVLTPSQAAALYPDSPPPPNVFLSTLFPNENGPIATVIRLAYRLYYQPWLPRWASRVLNGRSGRRRDEIKGRAAKAIDLLQHAVDLGHEEALFTMAQVSLFPPPAMPLNVSRAFDAYSRHADLTGNATSQAALGFFYATGYGGVVELDQSQALLHYTFAALSGSQRAQMIMGYRHWAGIGVNEDCMAALGWYEASAEKAMAQFLEGPPGGRTLLPTSTRLSDLEGGAYGPGASVASTGGNSQRAVVRAALSRAAGEVAEDVLEYYQYHADRGGVEYSYRIGKIYYHGSIYWAPGGAASGAEGVGFVGRDFARARMYFVSVTRLVWPISNLNAPLANQKKDVEDDVGVNASLSAGYLGRMYLRGEGVKKDPKVAKMWFERGTVWGDRESHNGLGLIYRDGLIDGKPDLAKALNHFKAAAGQDLAEAQVNLGKHYYGLGDVARATKYFDTAIRHGSPFEAYYYIAEIHSNQAHDPQASSAVRGGSCGLAVSFYKLVAERGIWNDNLVGEAERLWDFNGVRWGGNKAVSSSALGGSTGSQRALREAEREAAKLRWMIAAETGSEVAQNNLAYLFDQDKSALRHTGLVPQPSNETARFALTHWIRSASQRNVDALVKVGDYYYHGIWHILTGGGNKSLNLFLGDPDADDHWYLGKAKAEFRKKLSGSSKGQIDGRKSEEAAADPQAESKYTDDDDPVQWARDRKREELERAQAEHDADGGYGPDDYFDAATSRPGSREGFERDDTEDDLILMMVVTAILLVLVYMRTRYVRPDGQAAQQGQQAPPRQ
ncbi:ERAD-associated protein [Tulasnella sp. 408]|nr:ERAD-associated protein [Tulasnella sp. 408]